MASHLSSNFLLMTREGIEQERPVEWQAFFIQLLGFDPSLWDEISFTINGKTTPTYLRRIGGKQAVIADWPPSAVGHYRLSVTHKTFRDTGLFTVEPSKITVQGFRLLLEDLDSRLPKSIAIGLQKSGGLAGIDLVPPEEQTLEAEVARMRRAVYGTEKRFGLPQLLAQISADPHRVLKTDYPQVHTARARRPHPIGLAQALQKRGLRDDDALPAKIPDRRVELDYDVLENRLVASVYAGICRRIRTLQLYVTVPNSDLGEELQRMQIGLLKARRQAKFLDEARGLDRPINVATMVLLRRRPYQQVFQLYLELRRGMHVHLDEPRIDAPLQNLPDLYQLWCSLNLVDLLLSEANLLGYKVLQERLIHRHEHTLLVKVLPDGRPALKLQCPSGTVVTFTPERTFGSTGEFRSISFQQRPDVVLEKRSIDDLVEMWVFDPKYKLDSEDHGDGTPKKLDIDKMHAYRDSIVRAVDGKRVVTFAAILYPGATKHFDPSVAAIGAVPDQALQFRNELSILLKSFL